MGQKDAKVKMKIFLDRKKSGHIAIDRMIPHWKSNDHLVYNDPSGCDVQLCLVRVESMNKLPIALRIDGIYYDLDIDYENRNSSISTANSLADAVIYQSEYSKKLCDVFLRPRKKKCIPKVIYNGVDPGWCGVKKKHDGINIIVISKWRRLKRLKEIIDLFLEFVKQVPDSKLHILGKLHDNKPVKHNKIIYYGMVERNVVGNILNISDFSLHLCKRDSCPNSVVETIGAKVPVITSNKCGGASEICFMTKGCIVCDGDIDNDFQPDHPYREEYNVLTPELYNNILQSMIMISKDKREVDIPEQLTARYMADSYIDIMEKIS